MMNKGNVIVVVVAVGVEAAVVAPVIVAIQNEILKTSENTKIFGIYDPAENDFDLNMWSSTNAEDVRSSIKRIKKINTRLFFIFTKRLNE